MNLIKHILVIFGLIAGLSVSNAQELIIVNNDTVVALTLEEARVINLICSENNALSKELDACDSIIAKQREIIKDLETVKISNDKIIATYINSLEDVTIKAEYYKGQYEKATKRKKIYFGSGLTLGLGLLLLVL